MKYSSDQVAALKQARANNPDIASFIDSFRHQFPSAKLTHLSSPEIEVGEAWPDGVSSAEAKDWFVRPTKTVPKSKRLTKKELAKDVTRYK